MNVVQKICQFVLCGRPVMVQSNIFRNFVPVQPPPFARCLIIQAMQSSSPQEVLTSGKFYWFIFNDANILLEKHADGTYSVPFGTTPPNGLTPQSTVHLVDIPPMMHMPDGVECVKAFAVNDVTTADSGYEAMSLRQSFHHLARPLYLAAGKCREILYWDAHTRFCSVCGAEMKLSTNISKLCPHCGNEVWPQLATAVIVLIRRHSPDGDPRNEQALLVHANNFRGNYYGLVAGFVETGETLEEAVCREVTEEVGFQIDNIRYFASQPWPYPSGLMVGFTADYVAGDIHLQRSELGSGGWYTRDNLPAIPDKLSIARRLIDHWVASLGPNCSHEPKG